MTRTSLHILPDTTTVVLRNVVGVTPLEGEGSSAQYYFTVITTGDPIYYPSSHLGMNQYVKDAAHSARELLIHALEEYG
jgi:hypothetical protein